MKKVFAINGGAGRVLAALPALEKYYDKNGDNFYILSEGGLEFFLGNRKLQGLTYDMTSKGVFENIIKPNDLVSPEPYRNHYYYNQKKNLMETFDLLINETQDHSDLKHPSIYLTKTEELQSLEVVTRAKSEKGKKKTIVFQPFGRSSMHNNVTEVVVDQTSRSLNADTYLKIASNLSKDYNIIYFGEHLLNTDTYSFKCQTNLRVWSGVIDYSDYFIGCDSVGQHMAYAFNKPGTVILGSTFAENITYPSHFQILKKENHPIMYSPIRIQNIDSDLADRYNDTCMDFSEKEIKVLIEKIRADISKKL